MCGDMFYLKNLLLLVTNLLRVLLIEVSSQVGGVDNLDGPLTQLALRVVTLQLRIVVLGVEELPAGRRLTPRLLGGWLDDHDVAVGRNEMKFLQLKPIFGRQVALTGPDAPDYMVTPGKPRWVLMYCYFWGVCPPLTRVI